MEADALEELRQKMRSTGELLGMALQIAIIGADCTDEKQKDYLLTQMFYALDDGLMDAGVYTFRELAVKHLGGEQVQ